jgi:hypothetical protein
MTRFTHRLATKTNAKLLALELELSQTVVTHQGYQLAKLFQVHGRRRIRLLATCAISPLFFR